jgi:hypothetical protein
LDFWSQFLTSHAAFNRRAYTKGVNEIIFCQSSFFSICDVAFQRMFLTPQTLKPNTCNSFFEADLTKASFGNGGHCSTIITSLSHSHYALTRAWLTTFWSFCFCTTMVFPKMWTFILAWS